MQKDIPSAIGKRVRLNSILKDGKSVILAFDHGFEHGPKDFPEDMLNPRKVVELGVKANFDAIMMTKGVAEITWDLWAGKIPLILKTTGKTSLKPQELQFLQYQISSVRDAIALGASAIAATVYWGAPQEEVMAERFARLVSECEEYGLPVMILAYPRGPAIKNSNDVEIVSYASRASAELGADLIKTHYTGSVESFEKVVKASAVPVLMSGGTRTKEEGEFLRVVKDVMQAGGAGVVVGRNVFQSQNFISIARAIMSIVHEELTPEEAIRR